MEVVNAWKGRKWKTMESSRLSKYSFAKRYQRLMKCQGTLLTGITYGQLKQSSITFQNAKRALMDTFQESGLGSWPSSNDGFSDFDLD